MDAPEPKPDEDSARVIYYDSDAEPEMDWTRVTLGDNNEPPPSTPAPPAILWRPRWGAKRSREPSPVDAATLHEPPTDSTQPNARSRQLRPTDLTTALGADDINDLVQGLTW